MAKRILGSPMFSVFIIMVIVVLLVFLFIPSSTERVNQEKDLERILPSQEEEGRTVFVERLSHNVR